MNAEGLQIVQGILDEVGCSLSGDLQRFGALQFLAHRVKNHAVLRKRRTASLSEG
jgi:hypothetical protein